MELTPEERRRIYEEEKTKETGNAHRFAAFLLCLLGVFALLNWASCSRDAAPTNDNQPPANYAQLDTPLNRPTPSPFKSPTPAPQLRPAGVADDDIIQEEMEYVNKEISYERLKKDARRYFGQVWAFSGRVFQIQESGGKTSALVSLDAWGSKTMFVTADFTTEFVERDQVYVIGNIDAEHTYTTVAGWNVTVPAIDAIAILKPSEAKRIRAGKKASK